MGLQPVAVIQINDPTSPIELQSWLTANPLTVISHITVRDNLYYVYYSSTVQTSVLKTGTLSTTTITANQLILTYTVPDTKIFFLQYLTFSGRLNILSNNSNPVYIGTVSLELPSGLKVITHQFTSTTQGLFTITFPQPIPVEAETVLQVVCTPAIPVTTWIVNFGGYEI